MSLPHALLGLLAAAPATGYELAREFESDLGRYAWQAGHASIYPELAKLAARDLVRVVDQGPRGSKTYDITEQGRAELRSWLLHRSGDGVVRNEGVLRMFLIPTLDPDDQRSVLTAIAEETAAAEAELRERLKGGTDPRCSPRAELGLLAGRFGLGQYRATHEWATRALEELDARVADSRRPN
ncbi:PadR family transcriptional regulator [Pseudonocardia humida]|uniref:PadR family transcriptional regulator n=1 Tax=Pseudonocardia humida TaxID=2800819 RepID=A0ABT1A1J4_9PSEU|nr:PadR family transcriptional regulator [Pseudonocardia humida]MCO1656674.1 PadR family transcriptional regulator [Pseudonocardia humida]